MRRALDFTLIWFALSVLSIMLLFSRYFALPVLISFLLYYYRQAEHRELRPKVYHARLLILYCFIMIDDFRDIARRFNTSNLGHDYFILVAMPPSISARSVIWRPGQLVSLYLSL